MLLKKLFKKHHLFSVLLSLSFLGATGSSLAIEKSPQVAQECFEQTKVDQLAKLIGQRLQLIEELAVYRWNHKQPLQAIDGEFIQERKESATNALQRFSAAQMDAAQAIMIEHFEKWVHNGVHKHEYTPDLEVLTHKLQETNTSLIEVFGKIHCENTQDKESLKIALGQALYSQGFSREVIDASLHF